MELGRSWNRRDPRLLCEQPSKRTLRRRRVLLSGDALHQLCHRLIRSPVFRRDTRNGVSKVPAIERHRFVDLSSQETFAEWTEGNKADAQLLERRKNLLFR